MSNATLIDPSSSDPKEKNPITSGTVPTVPDFYASPPGSNSGTSASEPETDSDS